MRYVILGTTLLRRELHRCFFISQQAIWHPAASCIVERQNFEFHAYVLSFFNVELISLILLYRKSRAPPCNVLHVMYVIFSLVGRWKYLQILLAHRLGISANWISQYTWGMQYQIFLAMDLVWQHWTASNNQTRCSSILFNVNYYFLINKVHSCASLMY